MSKVWVANASPVIVLAKVGRLHLLEQLPDDLLLPDPVAAEILAGPRSDPARQALESGWGTRTRSTAPPPAVVEWGLGAGETAVLAAAMLREGVTAVLDDSAARMCARANGVPVIGTLGVVLRARRENLTPSAANVLRALVTAGLYLDDKTIRAALRSVGEVWDAN